jgi:hypothetical protein
MCSMCQKLWPEVEFSSGKSAIMEALPRRPKRGLERAIGRGLLQ